MEQRNVQQQNDSTEATIRARALRWRATGWPKALLRIARERGIECERSVLVHLEVDFPGEPRLFGTLLTADGRFIKFEIDTDPLHEEIECIEVWQDVTGGQNLKQHNRGIGVGQGALALKVLKEINAGKA